MKGWISILLGLIIQLSFGQSTEIAFRLAERDLIPEGITYDPLTKTFYIGSINKKKIVKLISIAIIEKISVDRQFCGPMTADICC